MKKNLTSEFHTRQYMISKDFEVYCYADREMIQVDRHSHDYYEFYFFLEGDVSFSIGEQLYPIHPGDLVLIPPGISHRAIMHSARQPYRRFVLWISRELYVFLLHSSPDYGYLIEYATKHNRYIYPNAPITFHAIQSRLLRLIEEIFSKRFGRQTQISLCFDDLLLYLNRIVYEKEHPIQDAPSVLENITSYIETHLSEDLSLETLADTFYISKYYLSHIFSEQFGLSLHQYIIKKRVWQCRNAIQSHSSIADAYAASGFRDYSSFYRAYKKEFGVSPKEDYPSVTTLS